MISDHAQHDRRLASVLRNPTELMRDGGPRAALLESAERHGVAGVVFDALRAAGAEVDPALSLTLERREVARELDHLAHLRTFEAIDRAFFAEKIAGIALKGALLAKRLYKRPAARTTTDIDLMVAEADLDRAVRSLVSVGYTAEEGPREEFHRREHHHLHLESPHAPMLELHFHAYRGFGQTMRSEPLLERRVAVLSPALGMVGVLAPEDELVYLAVHAAAHRFLRLGWLYDICLLLDTMTADQIALARTRAEELGYERVLAFTADLLHDKLDVPRDRVAPLGTLGGVRGAFVRAIFDEPENPIARSASRFAYSAALCSNTKTTVRYGLAAIRSRFTR